MQEKRRIFQIDPGLTENIGIKQLFKPFQILDFHQSQANKILLGNNLFYLVSNQIEIICFIYNSILVKNIDFFGAKNGLLPCRHLSSQL